MGRYISGEQFGFLRGRQIHDAIGIIQEGMHTIHSKGLKSVVLKIALSKSYDQVSWTYLQVILSKMGFAGSFISWVMSSMSSVSFALLVNGVASPLFKYGRGLRQGFPLAPLLFLIVVQGLSRALLNVKDCGFYHGITFSNDITLSHVLFLDDIVIFSKSVWEHEENLILVVKKLMENQLYAKFSECSFH